MSETPTKPSHTFTHVCTLCELPWYRHLSSAQDRYYAAHPEEYNKPVVVPVENEDCDIVRKRMLL